MRLVGQKKGGLMLSHAFVVFFALAVSAAAQDITKKPLDHDAYDRWQTIAQDGISNDGRWIMYRVQNGAIEGESITHFFNPSSSKKYSVRRATGVIFSHDSRLAIYRVLPEKAGKDGQKDPAAKPTLEILELSTGKLTSIPSVRAFSLPEKSGHWLACQLEAPAVRKSVTESKSPRESYRVTGQGLAPVTKPIKLKSRETLAREQSKTPSAPASSGNNAPSKNAPKSNGSGSAAKAESSAGRQSGEKKDKATGGPFLLVDLKTGFQRTYPSVLASRFSKDGKLLALVTSVKKNSGGADSNRPQNDLSGSGENEFLAGVDGVHLIDLDSFATTSLVSGVGEYRGLAFSDDGAFLSFLSNHEDYQAKHPSWNVYLSSTKRIRVLKVASEMSNGVPPGWWVSARSSLRFSKDNARLYFDTEPLPEDVHADRESKKDGSQSSESEKKAKLDLWHWKDPTLQPQQLLRADSERKRTYQAAYHLRGKRVCQLEEPSVPSVQIYLRSDATLGVANINLPYQKTLSWDYPGFQDVYLVDLNTGERKQVAKKVRWNAGLSPEGKYLVWFDAEKRHWFAQSTSAEQAKPLQISSGINYPLQNELHDTPNLPRAYGTAGWLKGDQSFLVYDRFDIWQLDPTGKQRPICLTMGKGRKQSIRYRYLSLDSEVTSIDPNDALMLSAFNTKTKASGFSSLDLATDETTKEVAKLSQLIMLDESLGGLKKAKESDQLVFTRSSFRNCADLWTTPSSFEQIARVSDINPQQDEYSWGTAELVHWKATDGQKLDGILMKPDDFDATKKYPMMVYFYERNSDTLHRYYTPAAGRSIICHSFYVSRGYLVFVPDIPYKTGQPGPSAVNAILPGVESLVDKGFVDSDRIGLQGHSWGGYQTAYLVTQTDRFACAESGAPVSNMTSAYGGIRWSSGLSRMFQYERTQSRIGEDLWAARDKYVANSPLFFADRINTPLLILHNDQDGAVPWYQGIELFVALRRLGRPAWMLNYNGEPHWVMDDYNRRDFAKRMQQFFDHYLLDAPEPQWMAVGIPATQKGDEFGFELLEPVKEAAQED